MACFSTRLELTVPHDLSFPGLSVSFSRSWARSRVSEGAINEGGYVRLENGRDEPVSAGAGVGAVAVVGCALGGRLGLCKARAGGEGGHERRELLAVDAGLDGPGLGHGERLGLALRAFARVAHVARVDGHGLAEEPEPLLLAVGVAPVLGRNVRRARAVTVERVLGTAGWDGLFCRAKVSDKSSNM